MGNEVFLSAENILFTVSMIGYFITMILFFVFFAMKNEKAGSTAAYLLSACFGVHTVALVVRTIGAGRLPLTNNYVRSRTIMSLRQALPGASRW